MVCKNQFCYSRIAFGRLLHIFTHPQQELWKGIAFTPVCDSVQGGCLPLGPGVPVSWSREGCLWVKGNLPLGPEGRQPLGVHPPGRHPTADTSLSRHPLGSPL